MQLIDGFPPNIEAIRNRFNLVGRNVVFTYGDKIFAPGLNSISEDLQEHEKTHQIQQAKFGVKEWWNRYLEDDSFRLSQEVEAYRKQYKYAIKNYTREHRRYLLKHIIDSISSKMYGNIVTKQQAEKLITQNE